MQKNKQIRPSTEQFPDLVRRARAGEQDAYTAIYEATSREVYRSIRSMVKREEDAEDIQQDSYVFAFSHLDQLSDPTRLLPWLRSIAVNRTRSVLRKQSPVLFSELETDDEPMPELPDVSTESSPELSLDRKESARLVQEILNDLTDGQQMLVGMYYYEQIPLGTIARDLEVNPGTVKTQLFRARKKIETRVTALEARGVRLYGLSPLPFLLALLKRQELPEKAEKATLTAALSKAGVAAESVAVHLGRSFFETLAGKLVLGVLSVAVLGGGVLGYRWVRDRLHYGDHRPTETVATAEDLTTEPAVTESTATPEDLSTEPVTTESAAETTEPTETTEPESTQPTEQGGAHTTEPGAGPGPAEPGTSAPGESGPGQSGGESTEPTEGDTPPMSSLLEWYWTDGGSLDREKITGEDGYIHDILVIPVEGYDEPILYTDNESVLRVSNLNENTNPYSVSTYEIARGLGQRRDARWSVEAVGDGTAHVFLEWKGVTVRSLTVTVRTPSRIVGAGLWGESTIWSEYGEQLLRNCCTGNQFVIYSRYLGTASPTLTADNPAVVQIMLRKDELDIWSKPVWEKVYDVQIVGAGDATITLSLGDEVYRSWTVHANSRPRSYPDSSEDLLPYDAPEQVMSWYMCDGSAPVLLTEYSRTLYVKMKGTEPPTVAADDPSVVSVTLDSQLYDKEKNETGYWYQITRVQSGSCRIVCSFRGETAFVIPVVVP